MRHSTARPFRILFALLCLAVLLAGCDAKEQHQPLTRIQGQTFGTFYEISIADTLSAASRKHLKQRVEAVLSRIDRQMSTYRDDSDLSRLNQAAPGEWVTLPEPVLGLLTQSHRISESTDGAFDITVGGLVNLWSFGPEARPQERPSDEELAQRLKRIGYDRIEVDEAGRRARRLNDVYVDLSAIAKGYAVDRLAELLVSQGYADGLVNIGGDLMALGRKGPDTPWRIGIEVPRDGRQRAQHAIPLHNQALATSGDYRNYFEQDGKRYSHTIDPRTGRPVQHSLASASVFHTQGSMADALATAFMAMGTEPALTYARDNHIATLLIERTGNGFVTHLSSALRDRLDQATLDKLTIQ